jgi:hypothetical protein
MELLKTTKYVRVPPGTLQKRHRRKAMSFFVRGREQEDIAERQCLFLLAALKLK